MIKLGNVVRFATDDNYRFLVMSNRGFCNRMSDEEYLKRKFKALMGHELDLSNPRTFNEKLQWLKLHDRRPLYTTLVDKYAVKEWVAARVGRQYVVPTYAKWDRVEDIDISKLPERFVLKTNHDSGGIAICRDRATFDLDEAKRKLGRRLRQNYYWECREWPYKDVVPCVFAEEYLDPSEGSDDLADYKYFCFSGEAKAMFVATNRFGDGETRFDFFDMEYRHLPFTNGHPNADTVPPRPEAFDAMREMAERLSAGIPQVRVDFYESTKGTYFGEMTFSHWGGIVPFDPPAWDETFGSWIELPGGSVS